MKVVSNTSPITSLAGIAKLELLQQLYERIVIPQAVYNEMVGIGKTVPGTIEVQTSPWIQTRPINDLNLKVVLALRPPSPYILNSMSSFFYRLDST
jgi:predicted nucleic acid-binding protein